MLKKLFQTQYNDERRKIQKLTQANSMEWQ